MYDRKSTLSKLVLVVPFVFMSISQRTGAADRGKPYPAYVQTCGTRHTGYNATGIRNCPYKFTSFYYRRNNTDYGNSSTTTPFCHTRRIMFL